MHRTVKWGRDKTVRRILSCWWVDNPRRWAAWLMLNPSTANHEKDDPTTRRITHFSKLWGYDGWQIVNLYPFVTSKPKELWQQVKNIKIGSDWQSRDDLQANLGDIETTGRLAAIRIVAFGTQPFDRDHPWVEQCLEAFEQPSEKEIEPTGLYCLGCSMDGYPLHPMARGKFRVPDNQKPELWVW